VILDKRIKDCLNGMDDNEKVSFMQSHLLFTVRILALHTVLIHIAQDILEHIYT